MVKAEEASRARVSKRAGRPKASYGESWRVMENRLEWKKEQAKAYSTNFERKA